MVPDYFPPWPSASEGYPSTMRSKTKAEYAKPPVVEVACGVLFDPLDIKLPHWGRFWEMLPDEFSEVQEAPPLASVVETATATFSTMTASGYVLPRIWFISKAGDQLVQLQRDRFLFNWRKTDPEHAYPRYENVFRDFEETFAVFEKFVAELKMAHVVARQYELTYINHIPRDQTWTSLDELGHVLPDLSWRPANGRDLPTPEAIDARFTFQLPNSAGRLHAHVQNGVLADSRPVLLLDLTARGYLEDRAAWFSLAHDWIIGAFGDLTHPGIQESVWGLRK